MTFQKLERINEKLDRTLEPFFRRMEEGVPNTLFYSGIVLAVIVILAVFSMAADVLYLSR